MALLDIIIDYERSYGSHLFCKRRNGYYLDMVNHYSSCALGYDKLPNEFYEEIKNLVHIKTSMGLYDSMEAKVALVNFLDFAAPLGFNFHHFTCTGSLAIEAAIKTSWAYAHDMKRRIVTLTNNFHGVNSFGNFTTTRDGQNNRLWGVPMAGWASEVSSLEQLKEFIPQLRDDVAAIIIEPIQCTNGDIHYEENFFKEVRQLCDEQNVVLIFDEIQTGFGATGRTWYWQHYGIEPDIIVFGKKAQVSGILVKDKFAKIFKDPMKLSVTYDGGLIDLIRSRYIIKKVREDGLLSNIIHKGDIIKEELNKLELKNVRGVGGIIAFDLDRKEQRDIFKEKCYQNGLLVNTAGEKSIRLRPNLNVSTEDVKECIEKIKISL